MKIQNGRGLNLSNRFFFSEYNRVQLEMKQLLQLTTIDLNSEFAMGGGEWENPFAVSQNVRGTIEYRYNTGGNKLVNYMSTH